MTGQISDNVLYKGEEHWLIGVKGGELVTPKAFGMIPEFRSTSNWRGFVVTYELRDEGLFMKELRLHARRGKYKPIEGKMPEMEEGEGYYKDLAVPVCFTGKMRLAREFLWEYYVHQGFQKPSAFKKVLDIELKKGVVVGVKDRSEEVEAIRGRYKEWYESQGESAGGILRRIKDAYSLDMDLE